MSFTVVAMKMRNYDESKPCKLRKAWKENLISIGQQFDAWYETSMNRMICKCQSRLSQDQTSHGIGY